MALSPLPGLGVLMLRGRLRAQTTSSGVPGSPANFWNISARLATMTPRPILVGPDAPMMPGNADYFVPLATKIINSTGGVLDAASFHFYAFFGYELVGRGPVVPADLASKNLSHMWARDSLDLIEASVRQAEAVLANTSYPHLPIWITETNSVCEGGVDGLSNTYANVPWLLNQLGR